MNHQKILDEISAILEREGVVMAPSVDEPGSKLLAFTLRAREDAEPATKLSVYGRNAYAEGSLPFNKTEAKAMQEWTAHWQREQAELFPRPEVQGLPRLENVRMLTRHSFYDGVLTGICAWADEIGHFAVFEEHERLLRPRTFCVWKLEGKQRELAQRQLDALRASEWAHLLYDADGESLPYNRSSHGSPTWPGPEDRAALEQVMQDDRTWITNQDVDGAPHAWFTYADTNLTRAQSRETELAERIEIAQEGLIESWDYGHRVEMPPAS